MVCRITELYACQALVLVVCVANNLYSCIVSSDKSVYRLYQSLSIFVTVSSTYSSLYVKYVLHLYYDMFSFSPENDLGNVHMFYSIPSYSSSTLSFKQKTRLCINSKLLWFVSTTIVLSRGKQCVC